MQASKNHLPSTQRENARRLSLAMRTIRCLSFTCVVVLLVPVAAQTGNSQTPLSNPPPRPTGVLLPAANRLPDANDQMEMREQLTKKQDYAAANAERKKQIADDSAKLLKLATDLKAEVDKTSKDTLSLGVIRKADEIERLAHIVKEKMKLTVGGN